MYEYIEKLHLFIYKIMKLNYLLLAEKPSGAERFFNPSIKTS